jgi:3-oxoacyl-[acyl-carrier protein] reductase
VDLQLKGHRAIVTGSSAGIGEAIARRLAAEGEAVIVHGRRAHAVSAVAEAISAEYGQAEGLTADLADPGNCARLISRALVETSTSWSTTPARSPTGAGMTRRRRRPRLAKHLDRTGITVNTVSPGIVVTPGLREFYRLEASRRAWGEDWPVIEADLVAFVASPLAGYINGANLRIDGGSTAVV